VAAGLSWPLPDELDDHGLEQLLFPPVVPSGIVRPTPDWKYVHVELRRKGVTLQLLWLEYREDPSRRLRLQPVRQPVPGL
jgi:transposase